MRKKETIEKKIKSSISKLQEALLIGNTQSIPIWIKRNLGTKRLSWDEIQGARIALQYALVLIKNENSSN